MKILASALLAVKMVGSDHPTAVLWKGEPLPTVAAFQPANWLMSLAGRRADGKTSYCTAVLVAPTVALTAGHCLVDVTSIEVMAATEGAGEFTPVASAVAWEAHPQTNGWDPPTEKMRYFSDGNAYKYVDLGIVALDRRIDLEPDRLSPPQLDPLAAPVNTYVFGRQRDEFYRSLPSFGVLRPESVRWYMKSSTILAKLPKGLWCVRDSGGPVAVEGGGEDGDSELQLVGIAIVALGRVLTGSQTKLRAVWGDDLSAVPTCADSLVYVHVGRNLTWIQDTMERLSPGSASELRFAQ